MSIAVNVNDPTNTGVNSTSSATGSSSLSPGAMPPIYRAAF